MTPTDPTPNSADALGDALSSLVTDPDSDDLRDWLSSIAPRVEEYLADAGWSIVPTDTTIRMEIHDGLVTIDNGYDWPDGLSRRMLEEHVEQLIEDR